jgi:outer membrane murein-binding lipoprotein Lpp
MTRAHKALAIMVVTSLGLWGCAQEQNHGSVAAKIRGLETKNAKLEEDFRAVVAAREQVRKKLAAVDRERGRLVEQLEQTQGAIKEREELRQQVSARTSERDAVQTQFDEFRKSIRKLLGQADSVANAGSGQPVTAAPRAHPQDKS